jgi:hypothetical protein
MMKQYNKLFKAILTFAFAYIIYKSGWNFP